MYCLITGGEMVNKGAQSMTFIIMNEIKKRYPDDSILLVLPDDTSSVDPRVYYIRPYTAHIKSVFYLLGGLAKEMSVFKKVDRTDAKKLDEILKQTRMLVDISGYTLGSNWGDYLVRFYLCMIHLSHIYNIPTYLMPQSFGPFDYPFPKSIISNWYIGKVMKYPNVVFAREKEGYDLLKRKYHLNNIQLSNDMVLMSREIDSSNIFCNEWTPRTIDIEPNSVLIIPNVRLLDNCDRKTVVSTYRIIAKQLADLGKSIYVMYHSGEDRDFSKQLSKELENDGIVNSYLDYDLNCIEFENFVLHFDGVIASRYHALVHSLKSGIPCIAIGWAVKYQELLDNMGISKYSFDIRNIDQNELCRGVCSMIDNHDAIVNTINSCLIQIQQDNIFTVLNM